MGIDGKHTSHHRFLLQYLLSIREIHLSGPAGNLPLDHGPFDQLGVRRWLSKLSWLVLGTLPGIVAIFAALEASTRLVSKSLARWDLLSLRLLGLHLLSRCMVLCGRSLRSLLGLPKQRSS